MKNNIPTAEELVLSIASPNFWELYNGVKEQLVDKIIEQNKLHVKAALEKAAEDANLIGETQHNNRAPDVIRDFVYVADSNGPDYGFTVNKESILDAYPEDLIK